MEAFLLHTQRGWDEAYIGSDACHYQIRLAGSAYRISELFRLPCVDDSHALGALGVGIRGFFLDHVEEEPLDIGLPI